MTTRFKIIMEITSIGLAILIAYLVFFNKSQNIGDSATQTRVESVFSDIARTANTKETSQVFQVPVGTTWIGARITNKNWSNSFDKLNTSPIRLSVELSLDGDKWLPGGGCGITPINNDVSEPGCMSSLPKELLNFSKLFARVNLESDIDIEGKVDLVFDNKELILSSSGEHHSVAYDSQGSTDGYGVTTLTTAGFTITSSDNRACLIGLASYTNIFSDTFTTITCSGTAGTAITDASLWVGASTVGAKAFQVIAPPNGASKTAVLTWSTSASYAGIGAMTASGVDQTTPFNNPNSNSGTSPSVTVTSSDGDLTATILSDGVGSGTATSNQTRKISQGGHAMDIGPGTGNTTHTWTSAGAVSAVLGVNFRSASTATLNQKGFLFRNDDGSETTATSLASENTDITRVVNTNTRLRILATTTGDLGSSTFQLEAKKSTDTDYFKVGSSTTPIAFLSSSTATIFGNGDSLAIGYATGTLKGDLLVIAIANKATSTQPTTPSGWTLGTIAKGGAGAAAADLGGTVATVFYKEADGTESGTVTVAIPSDNVSGGGMFAYRKGTALLWDIAAVGGADNTGGGTDWVAATTTNPGITVGDIIFVASAANTDAYTYSLQNVTATDATIGTNIERVDAGTAVGLDERFVVSDHIVSAGTASAGPSYQMTASGSATNAPAGASVMLRIRANIAPIHLVTSANIADAGEATTAQLTPPLGTTTAAFTAGQMNDVKNPTDAIDILLDHYTELEWNLMASSTAVGIYQFRVTLNGTAFATYAVTPQWTVGTVAVSGKDDTQTWISGD